MSDKKSVELRVSVDVGYRRHSVAIGLPSGEVLEEFEISHRPEGFAEFFSRIEKHQKVRGCQVSVAMEGFNGCARPLDAMVRRRGYRLYNINNLKLARFKEIFPGAAKSDRIDARKGLELFQLSDHLPLAKEITKNAGNQWFLNFLVSAATLPQLARLRPATLLKVRSGQKVCEPHRGLAEASPF